jgi:hypothetical protein
VQQIVIPIRHLVGELVDPAIVWRLTAMYQLLPDGACQVVGGVLGNPFTHMLLKTAQKLRSCQFPARIVQGATRQGISHAGRAHPACSRL